MSEEQLPDAQGGAEETQRERRNGKEVSRRDFLQQAAVVAGSATLAAAAGGCVPQFLIKKPVSATVGTQWGMIVDLKKCVGCRSCTVACKAENHTPPGIFYNVVLEEETGEYPNVQRRFIFRPCMHCKNPSCVPACPINATSRRDDGIVVVDYDKCTGIGACVGACPYEARYLDDGSSYLESPSPYDGQPSPEYGENRTRENDQSPIGKVRKCTFCLHRLTKGLSPACAQTCIGHAIHFGNLNDPEGQCVVHDEKLQDLLKTRRHMRLQEETGNDPSVYYLT
jgi:molybdopterin-containing oxidoreductase family iron-sulfur binding subunit